MRISAMLNEGHTKDQNDAILFNATEDLVIEAVDDLIRSMDMCDCKICRLNACAIALNALPPHYVTTTKGRLFAKISTEMAEYQAEVVVEVTKALMIVKEHPMH